MSYEWAASVATSGALYGRGSAETRGPSLPLRGPGVVGLPDLRRMPPASKDDRAQRHGRLLAQEEALAALGREAGSMATAPCAAKLGAHAVGRAPGRSRTKHIDSDIICPQLRTAGACMVGNGGSRWSIRCGHSGAILCSAGGASRAGDQLACGLRRGGAFARRGDCAERGSRMPGHAFN